VLQSGEGLQCCNAFMLLVTLHFMLHEDEALSQISFDELVTVCYVLAALQSLSLELHKQSTM
jgi:hypothetical protein